MLLYHGSSTTGLTEIRPRLSTHGRVVYATAERLVAFYFAGARCARGRRHIRVVNGVVEFVGSREVIDQWLTRGRTVSIYRVPVQEFDQDTQWAGWEFISQEPVGVVREEVIDDWSDMLHDLVSDGKIRLVEWA